MGEAGLGDWIALLVGVVLAGAGGELFVRGAVGIAVWLRVPAGIIAATVAAFATSSPELVVSATAAVSGRPELALGNALGSNVTNLGLIAGVAMLLAAMDVDAGARNRDLPTNAISIVLLGLLALDGELSHLDGAVLVTVFVGWLGSTVVAARRDREDLDEVGATGVRAVAAAVGGLILLFVAGRLVVDGGAAIGLRLGIDPFIVGATIVAIATSVPELATVLIASARGHGDVALGTVLGSNIFNALLVVGLAALIRPIPVRWEEMVLGLGFGAVVLLAAWPGRTAVLRRRRGLWLLAAYGAYLLVTVAVGPLERTG